MGADAVRLWAGKVAGGDRLPAVGRAGSATAAGGGLTRKTCIPDQTFQVLAKATGYGRLCRLMLVFAGGVLGHARAGVGVVRMLPTTAHMGMAGKQGNKGRILGGGSP